MLYVYVTFNVIAASFKKKKEKKRRKKRRTKKKRKKNVSGERGGWRTKKYINKFALVKS